jgi:hypothetical protein
VVEAGHLAVRLVVGADIEPCRLWHDSHGIAELRDALFNRQLRLSNFLWEKNKFDNGCAPYEI